jgi:hypothetical protein
MRPNRGSMSDRAYLEVQFIDLLWIEDGLAAGEDHEGSIRP